MVPTAAAAACTRATCGCPRASGSPGRSAFRPRPCTPGGTASSPGRPASSRKRRCTRTSRSAAAILGSAPISRRCGWSRTGSRFQRAGGARSGRRGRCARSTRHAEERRQMQQLTGLDASFLAFETATSTGHVGGVCVLDPSGAPEPLTLARLTEVLAERLPLVPVLRRKLLNVPLGLDQPYWVDDPDFDIEYHIREIALPRPGSDAQLTEQVARLHARPLDRSRPLWEIYLITGLAKRRAAVYTKIHHSAIDGASGAELLTILLDLTPEGREVPAQPPFAPARPPGPVALAAKAAAKLAWRPVEAVRLTNELVRVLPTLAPALSTLVGGMLGLNRGDGEVILTSLGRAPVTPFNRAITPHRRLALRSVDLESVKTVKNAFGVSVNDVVLAMCAGALRRWLADHDSLPDAPLITMIPVSVRDPASKTAMGNKVSAMLATLPTNLADAAERVAIVHAATKVA